MELLHISTTTIRTNSPAQSRTEPFPEMNDLLHLHTGDVGGRRVMEEGGGSSLCSLRGGTSSPKSVSWSRPAFPIPPLRLEVRRPPLFQNQLLDWRELGSASVPRSCNTASMRASLKWVTNTNHHANILSSHFRDYRSATCICKIMGTWYWLHLVESLLQ